MLKKLRLKFILINMTIFTIMMGVLLASIYVSTSRNIAIESMRMMGRIADQPKPFGAPNRPADNIRLPYFSIVIGDSGEITEINGDQFDLSDEEFLKSLSDAVNLGDERNSFGVLKEYNLRYFASPARDGCIHVVFADMTSEQATLRHLIQNCLLTGLAAFLVFLLISIALARWAIKPVEQAWQQQKQFVADASHELKTPLTVIMTDAELLHSPGCTVEEVGQLSGSILTMTEQMRGLVENLLELARVDNGSVKDTLQSFDLSDTASNASMMFEPVFFEKGMTFEYEIEPDILFKGYPTHLKQLVDILLDNASKYASPEGKTILRLRKTGTKLCVLEVMNEGEPISSEDLPNLFKRFYRADKARTMNHSYGLGLSIAQSITEEHHGKISAKSVDGYNCFTVELPL